MTGTLPERDIKRISRACKSERIEYGQGRVGVLVAVTVDTQDNVVVVGIETGCPMIA